MRGTSRRRSPDRPRKRSQIDRSRWRWRRVHAPRRVRFVIDTLSHAEPFLGARAPAGAALRRRRPCIASRQPGAAAIEHALSTTSTMIIVGNLRVRVLAHAGPHRRLDVPGRRRDRPRSSGDSAADRRRPAAPTCRAATRKRVYDSLFGAPARSSTRALRVHRRATSTKGTRRARDAAADGRSKPVARASPQRDALGVLPLGASLRQGPRRSARARRCAGAIPKARRRINLSGVNGRCSSTTRLGRPRDVRDASQRALGRGKWPARGVAGGAAPYRF